ncbi:HAD-IIIC family phosphatase [Dactylosporangium matsuzakiense]|uniref:HAD-superfamily phosphatase, subfamily IIIC:FkbH n=1 Tax=Dactylosporangium matsuzakiense TaxID=53360 RepID=A0A9W6KID9_9ACTN|nr:HAD-IIIC family phosphatase [Dactylosporangium matsuzakiense]UWZ45880.1 HAD-IIIC family phosphatase [Dactylosporangium matsuzakiense]GLL00099.1 HAD-superfamily phosphatase, subfamily IIIC:FkbH [Dactylosporangium matsuzakiense]
MTSVLELHRAGELAARYPEVRALLAEPGAEPAIAGRLLSRLDADEVHRRHPEYPVVSVAITGHGTVAQVVAPLTAQLARHGLLARCTVADFDSYVRDLGAPDSDLYAAGADLVLCLLDANVVLDELPVPWAPADASGVLAAKLALLRGLAATFQHTGAGTLVLNTLPLPHRAVAQLIDHRSRARFCAAWHEYNAGVLRLAEDFPALVVIDLAPLIAEGIAAEDPRMSCYAGAHLSAELLARYAREAGHLARNLTGRTSKVLALDLDGTVWGGILAEDGPDGLEISEGHTGSAFAAFQRVAKQLAAQGILVAAVSKNDADAVRAVFRDRADLTLAEDDFVRVVANWRPKHENLTELAAALNVGVESIVFVDDSTYECGLVRHELPGVAVVPVTDEPALHVEALLRDGWFTTRDLTAEDTARVTRYREELVRQDFMDSFDSMEAYQAQLGVAVRIEPATPADVPRVSQLTLRTNQFNLTVERLQPPAVQALLDDPAHRVLTIRSADRFGDNGLVGALLTHTDGDVVTIDNFLLSCRVFGRGIEAAALSAVLLDARRRGCTAVVAAHRAGAKNSKVLQLYPRHGFVRAEPGEAGAGVTWFRHDLRDIADPPKHIDLADGTEGGRP